MAPHVTAVTGAAGGVGTTRLAVEFATMLARDGQHAAVLDVAVDTQGLAAYHSARLDPDFTQVLTDDTPVTAALVEYPTDTPGDVMLCPARAALSRLAEVKTATAARQLGTAIDALPERIDHVLLDTPPVATNPAIAAVTTCDRPAIIVPSTQRGVDALRRTEGRFRDIGVDPAAVITTFGDTSAPVEIADAAVPRLATPAPGDAPIAAAGTGQPQLAIANATEAACGVSLENVSLETSRLGR